MKQYKHGFFSQDSTHSPFVVEYSYYGDETAYDELGREICYHEECLKDIENPDSLGAPAVKSGRELWKDMYRSLREDIGLGAMRADHFFKAMWALVDTYDRYSGQFYSAPSALLADSFFPYWVASSFALLRARPVADLMNKNKEPHWVGFLIKEYLKDLDAKSANILAPVRGVLAPVIAGMFLMKTAKTPVAMLWWPMANVPAKGRPELLGTALASVFIKYEKMYFCDELEAVGKLVRRPEVAKRCNLVLTNFFNLKNWAWYRITDVNVLEESTGGRPELLLWLYDEKNGIYNLPDEVREVVSSVRSVLLKNYQFRKKEKEVIEKIEKYLI